MLEFLKECGISQTVLNKIEEENSSSNLYNLNCNQEEVIKIVQYFTSLGINCIDQLLIYKIDLFFMSFDEINDCFSKQEDLGNFVELINEDYDLALNL